MGKFKEGNYKSCNTASLSIQNQFEKCIRIMNNAQLMFLEKARKELGEDDNIKNQSLKQFREWIEKQAFIKKCRKGECHPLKLLVFN
jgi:hypothetical protein